MNSNYTRKNTRKHIYKNKKLVGGDLVVTPVVVHAISTVVASVSTYFQHSYLYNILVNNISVIVSYNTIASNADTIMSITTVIMDELILLKRKQYELANTDLFGKISSKYKYNPEFFKHLTNDSYEIIEKILVKTFKSIGYKLLLDNLGINIEFIIKIIYLEDFKKLLKKIFNGIPEDVEIEIKPKNFLGLCKYNVVHPGFLKEVMNYIEKLLEGIIEHSKIIPSSGRLLWLIEYRTDEEKESYNYFVNFYKKKIIAALKKFNRISTEYAREPDTFKLLIEKKFKSIILKSNLMNEIRNLKRKTSKSKTPKSKTPISPKTIQYIEGEAIVLTSEIIDKIEEEAKNDRTTIEGEVDIIDDNDRKTIEGEVTIIDDNKNIGGKKRQQNQTKKNYKNK